MSEQKQTKQKPKLKLKKPDFKFNFSNTVLIIGVIIIAIPVCILGWVLFDAYVNTGSVIKGDRFDGDLNPAITQAQIEEISNKVKLHPEVEEIKIELPVATLRIYVDVLDNMKAEDYVKLTEALQADLYAVLSDSIYFTQQNTKKMYDYEIHVYNLKENRDADNFIYYIMNKSSSMILPTTQLASEPRNPDLAQELRDAMENKDKPKDEGDDITGGSSDAGEENGEKE